MFTRNLLRTLITTEPLNSVLFELFEPYSADLFLHHLCPVLYVLIRLRFVSCFEVGLYAICEMYSLSYVSFYANSGLCNIRFGGRIIT